ncbi:MAG: protease complex subunit PrcB family protein [Candidatus Hodarchaeales archaeon]
MKINTKFSNKKIAPFIGILIIVNFSIIFLIQYSDTIFMDNSADYQPLEFESIYYDVYSGLSGRTEQLITTQTHWEEIWNMFSSNIIPQPLILEVNFDKEMIVVVSTGEKPTTGYPIEVTDVKIKSNTLFIYTTEMFSETQDCGRFPMMTNSVEVIKFQRISFDETIFERTYQECNINSNSSERVINDNLVLFLDKNSVLISLMILVNGIIIAFVLRVKFMTKAIKKENNEIQENNEISFQKPHKEIIQAISELVKDQDNVD